MKIGIEAERANIQNPTGVEHYAKRLILALAEADKLNDYILYLRSEPQDWIKKLPANFKYKVMPFPIFWTQLRISWEMIWRKPDVLFIMASALPIVHPKNSVVTIHDIAWAFYPETFKPFTRNFLRFSTWYACIFAKNIIAVSEQTKKDLLERYKIKAEKIRVVHHGFDKNEMFEDREHGAVYKAEMEKINNLPQKFILYLGTLQPRKNISGLIDAYIDLVNGDNIEHSLVIAGGKGWMYDQIMEKIKTHPQIIYFGYVHDRFALLHKAELLVQPAFYEGFGLQILDAFAAKVPVASSNVSSLPEVAGDAAVYFNPNSIAEIKDAIIRGVNDAQLRATLISRGTDRLASFTWQKCAQQTLSVLTSHVL